MTLVLIGFLFLCNVSLAWESHYLVTDKALSRETTDPFLARKVRSEPLAVFLKREKSNIAQLFSSYYDWLEHRKSNRFRRIAFDVLQPGERSFLRAARLYPETEFFYVRRLFPGQTTRRPVLALHVLSPFEQIDPKASHLIEEVGREPMSIREVLETYSDEPDWYMDHALWQFPEYGYGTMPYGKVNDPTSGAAFHMQFAHENFLIKALVPTIADGMALDRLELFTRLSQLAFKTHHDYWGARFCAWAFHYIEDLSQPYHSKPVPYDGLKYYVRFLLSPNKKRFIRDTTQLVSNRHYIYEGFTRILLERSYLFSESKSPFSRATQPDSAEYAELAMKPDTYPLFDKVTEVAVAEAPPMDRAVVRAYGPHYTEDPSYQWEADTEFNSVAVFSALSPGAKEKLTQEAVKNLQITGEAVRSLWNRCKRR